MQRELASEQPSVAQVRLAPHTHALFVPSGAHSSFAFGHVRAVDVHATGPPGGAGVIGGVGDGVRGGVGNGVAFDGIGVRGGVGIGVRGGVGDGVCGVGNGVGGRGVGNGVGADARQH